MRCLNCNGVGSVAGTECPRCDGIGEVSGAPTSSARDGFERAVINRALELLDDDNLDRGDGMSVDTMLSAIREAREVLELAR